MHPVKLCWKIPRHQQKFCWFICKKKIDRIYVSKLQNKFMIDSVSFFVFLAQELHLYSTFYSYLMRFTCTRRIGILKENNQLSIYQKFIYLNSIKRKENRFYKFQMKTWVWQVSRVNESVCCVILGIELVRIKNNFQWCNWCVAHVYTTEKWGWDTNTKMNSKWK